MPIAGTRDIRADDRWVVDELGRIVGVENISGGARALFVRSDAGGANLQAPAGGAIAGGLAASMAAAYANNAFTQPPLSPAPTWTGNANYPSGSVVRGAAAGSTLNLYMQVAPNGAISAASGGPTGTASPLITDNTCVWQYIGAATSTGTYPYLSTVIPTVASDVMNGYTAVINQNNYAALGLTPVVATPSAPLFRVTNTLKSDAITLIPKNSGTAASPTRSSSSLKPAVRFVTNAKKWIAFHSVNAIYQYSNSIRQIKVNGRYLSERHFHVRPEPMVNPGALMLDLSGFPAGNKLIEVFLNDNLATFFFGLALGVGDFAYPAPATNDFRIAIEGDSIADMSYFSPSDATARPDIILGEYLGSTDVFNNAIGGSGFLATANNTRTTYAERLPDLVSFNPHLTLVAGNQNDVTQGTPALRRLAYLDYFRRFRAALPNCTLALTGAHMLAGNSIPTFTTLETELRAAFTEWNDSNSIFIPILTATPRVIDTANGYMFQAGNVPAGYSDGHPVSWYYYHMYRYIADRIMAYYSGA